MKTSINIAIDGSKSQKISDATWIIVDTIEKSITEGSNLNFGLIHQIYS